MPGDPAQEFRVVIQTIDTDNDGATGTVEAGFVTIGIFNCSDVDATFNGQDVPAGSTQTYPAVLNKSYPALDWDATGARLLINAFK